MNLTEYFQNVGYKLKNDQYHLKEFIITKQIGRAPSEYGNPKSLPHVYIALRIQQEQGKTDSEQINQYIPYAICKGESKHYAERAFLPEEIIKSKAGDSKSKLEIDVKWYSTQQILPPISRLIDPIEGIDRTFIAQSLGIDISKISNSVIEDAGDNRNEDMIRMYVGKDFQDNEKRKTLTKFNLMVSCIDKKCIYNKKEYEFPGIMKGNRSGLLCLNPKCNMTVAPQYVENKLKQILTQLRDQYYNAKYICNDSSCGATSIISQLNLDPNSQCGTKSCMSKVSASMTEKHVSDTLGYLNGLFDIASFKKWREDKGKDLSANQVAIFNRLHSIV